MDNKTTLTIYILLMLANVPFFPYPANILSFGFIAGLAFTHAMKMLLKD